MSHSVPKFSLFVLLLVAVGLLPAQFQAHAATRPRAVHTTQPKVSTAVLVWQGKVLPIVIAVYSSFNGLDAALQAHDVQGLSVAANQFAVEQQQFARVRPTPVETHVTAGEIASGLKDLADGTKALVTGVQASDNAVSQRAATQIVKGLNLFQKAVDQIRKASGNIIPTNGSLGASAGPQATPIIRGLP